jgi:hypothetical protein
MGSMVLTGEFLSLNASDLSTYTSKAELAVEVEEKDVTTYGSAGWKENLGGLKSGNLGIEFKQSFTAAELDAIMWPLLGTKVAFVVKPVAGTTTTSNPAYSGTVLIKGWNPITGSVGDAATVSVAFPTSGAVTRTTA